MSRVLASLSAQPLPASILSSWREQLARFPGADPFWLDRSSPQLQPGALVAETLAHVAAHCSAVCGASAADQTELAGVEVWAQRRRLDTPMHLHFDIDEERGRLTGALRCPQLSCVLYMSDEGGPTLLLERRLGSQHGWGSTLCCCACWPLAGHILAFEGDLLHGVLAEDDGCRNKVGGDTIQSRSDGSENGVYSGSSDGSSGECDKGNDCGIADHCGSGDHGSGLPPATQRVTIIINLWRHAPLGTRDGSPDCSGNGQGAGDGDGSGDHDAEPIADLGADSGRDGFGDDEIDRGEAQEPTPRLHRAETAGGAPAVGDPTSVAQPPERSAWLWQQGELSEEAAGGDSPERSSPQSKRACDSSTGKLDTPLSGEGGPEKRLLSQTRLPPETELSGVDRVVPVGWRWRSLSVGMLGSTHTLQMCMPRMVRKALAVSGDICRRVEPFTAMVSSAPCDVEQTRTWPAVVANMDMHNTCSADSINDHAR